MRAAVPVAVFVMLVGGARAHAQTTATVRGDRVGADRARVEGGSRFATSIDVRTRGALAESVSELLDEAPGLHVRRTGDGFAPQSLTLRGAPGAHVTVALDGVVLNDAASDGVDLALVPPALLERADVYRGNAPMRLGVSGLGGALELVTRRPDAGARAWAAAGYGSFGARRASLLASVREGRAEALVALGYRGSEGNFSFYDDRGTPRLAGVVSERQNAASDALDLLARACLRSATGERGACLMVLSGWRARQVPGPGSNQSDGPLATQRRTLARLSVPLRVGALRGEAWAASVARTDVFENTGPVPLFNTAPYVARSTAGMLEAGASSAVAGSWITFEPALRVRREVFSGGQFASTAIEAQRWSALAGYEVEARAGSVRLTQGAGVEAIADRGAEGEGTRAPFTVRVGAVWTPRAGFEVRANGGHAQRAPTLPELYGDRGFIRGDASLRPERAWHADLGAVLTVARGAWRARAELAGYVRSVDDMIALVQVNRSRFQPVNLGAVRVAGVEAQARVAWGRALRLTASYALVDARIVDASALDGNRVPGVPLHDLYASLEGTLAPRRVGPIALGANVSYVSEAFLDETNDPVAAMPARALVGASASWSPAFARWLSLGVSVTNLFDQRTATRTLPDGSEGRVPLQDYFGYPLPGRSVFASLTLATAPDPL